MSILQKVFLWVFILMGSTTPLYAELNLEDYFGVWIFRDEQGGFDPFIPAFSIISLVEGRVFVITVRHYVDSNGSIRARTTHGFFKFEDGKLVRRTNVGITNIYIDSVTGIMYDEFIGTSGVHPDRDILYRAKIDDFKERIDYYGTQLE